MKATEERAAKLDRLGVRCTSIKQCTRWGRCWSERSGRHCYPHMAKLEPRHAWWYA